MVKIGRRRIGRDAAPFVIAEMSGNHNQSLDRALAIVDAAAQAGVAALKIQTYTADIMTLDLDEREFRITDPASPWAGSSLHALYARAATPWDWHEPIFERARQRGLIPFSTPFDVSAVEFLERFDPPCFKVASFENTDLPLIRRAAATGRPLMISTGMATVAELDEAVTTARGAGCTDLILLKCTSAYPASPEFAHVRTVPDLRERFNCEVGLSDHTPGVGVALSAVALGATVIEKHFTLSRADGGVDSEFSLEPAEMANLVIESERAWRALGEIWYGPTEEEIGSIQFRRSLYIVRDLKAGDLLTAENVRAIRPGHGLAVKHLEQVLGRAVKHDVRKGTRLAWDLLR
jgi:N-acetylneuraminate synthase